MKKLLAIGLIAVLSIGMVGCQQANKPGEVLPMAGDNTEASPNEITNNTIDFERVEYDELKEDMKSAIDEEKVEKGYKLFKGEESDYYLAVFGGEKPSAGYAVEITKVMDNEGVTDVMVKETKPEDGMMVAEVLTYPMDIVKLKGITDNINVIYLTSEGIEDEGKEDEGSIEDPNAPVSNSPEGSSTLLETQFVVAEYVGQIDNNSIEVKIEDGSLALRLNGIAKDQLTELELSEGDLVKLEVFKNDAGQQTIYSMEKAK